MSDQTYTPRHAGAPTPAQKHKRPYFSTRRARREAELAEQEASAAAKSLREYAHVTNVYNSIADSVNVAEAFERLGQTGAVSSKSAPVKMTEAFDTGIFQDPNRPLIGKRALPNHKAVMLELRISDLNKAKDYIDGEIEILQRELSLERDSK